MKRFYKDADPVAMAGGHGIALDGRPVRTPGRALLVVPTPALAQAIADEWHRQDADIRPETMRMTGLANAAIDHIANDPSKFARDIAAYGGSDLFCYRATSPAALVARQADVWDPLLAWAAQRYDIALRTTAGVIPVDQPPATLARLHAAVAALDPFTLAALSTLVSLSGSLVAGLALVEQAHDLDAIWDATDLDERWQAELWGEDAEAAARTALRREEFETAAQFCRLAHQ